MNHSANSDREVLELYQTRADAISDHLTVSAMLDAAAIQVPDAIAIDWFEAKRQVTYGEMHQKVLRLSTGLASVGIGKGTHVATMLGPSADWAFVLLALARLGAVNIPLNTSYTNHETHSILARGDAEFAIAESRFLEVLRSADLSRSDAQDTSVIRLGSAASDTYSLETLMSVQHEVRSDQDVGKSALMMLLPTSGTTGTPKLCMLTQGYWAQIAAREAAFYGKPLGVKRVLIWQPPYYMAGPFRLFLSISLRGTALIPERMSLSRFIPWLVDQKVDYCTLPERVYQERQSDFERRSLSLKYVHTFAWTPSGQRAFYEATGVPPVEGMGMSETGIVTIAPIELSDIIGSGSCGFAAPGFDIRVVDSSGLLTDPGEIGQLAIASQSGFLGYYRNDEATKSVLRDGMFLTGDDFVRDARGLFFFKGRRKEIIKRSGENISAREVELTMLEHPKVLEAAAVPRLDPWRGQEVEVHLRLSPDTSPHTLDHGEILELCNKRLASYKHPRYLVFCSEFPRTPTGKIRKFQLSDNKSRFEIMRLDLRPKTQRID